MKNLFTPRHIPVSVPETEAEDQSPKFSLDNSRGFLEYYRENGYVVLGNCISPSVCDQMREVWEREVKPFNGFMYRQATAMAEKHVFNENGWVMNPILNLQSLDPRRFPQFRAVATHQVLANRNLTQALQAVLGDKPKIVQSMYFEGNSATWEHQDSYYLDSEHIGSMAAAWIAVEDIEADAGRFFVCPKSHKIDLIKQNRGNSIADNHEKYIRQVVDAIVARNLEIRAPCLKKGDVLLWNAFTIHGSLDSQSTSKSRSSITCHAICASHDFLQFHTRKMRLQVDEVECTQIFRPKDLARIKNRLILSIEGKFPRPFYGLKKFVIKRLFAESRG